MTGRVYLVGAGPGDPGLITRRGLELLRDCEVVVYDRLVSPELLDEAPDGAERVFVGKDPRGASLPQAWIDKQIVENARRGKRVVRLKGGDPFVFGRGADEAQALLAAGIGFEIVPGVTSAIAAPAYAGIPVTHSGISSSFTVLTAHESSQRPESQARWEALATGAGTLVLLMGVSSLRETTRRLIEAGRDPDEAAAVVEWGTTPRQRTIVSTLKGIADEAQAAAIEPPATTIVGPVVDLRRALEWYETLPLFGMKVVVTRARAQSRKLGSQLKRLGANVVYLPTVELLPPASWEPLDVAILGVADVIYDWIVFSSVNGVDRFFERLHASGLDTRALGQTKVAAVGAITSKHLRGHGINVDLVPAEFTGAALAESLGRGPGRVLMPRPEDAPREGVEVLSANGWTVEEVAAYRTVPASTEGDVAREVLSGEFDAVTFTSAATLRHFVAFAGDVKSVGIAEGQEGGPKVVCIGPRTAEEAGKWGMRVDAVADPHTIDGLLDALVATFDRGAG